LHPERKLLHCVVVTSGGKSKTMEAALYTLLLLACPVGMGAMMWFMSRGSRAKPSAQDSDLRTVDELRAEQMRISSEIDRLSPREETEGGRLTGSRR